MTKVPTPYLLNIAASIEAIYSYAPDSEEALNHDAKSYDAILMRLQDVGENLTQIRDKFPDFWEENHNTAWDKAIGLRNIISHGYAEIKLSIIWELVSSDLTAFKLSIDKLL